MLIDKLVPIASVTSAGMVFHLLDENVHSLAVLLVASLLIDVKKDFTGVDKINVICFRGIFVDSSI